MLDLDHHVMSAPTDQAYGYATASYWFGIGGNKTSSLLLEAKNNLPANRSLDSKEDFQNITINKSYFVLLPFVKKTVVISTDVDHAQNISKGSHPFHGGDTLYNSSQRVKGIFLGSHEDGLFLKPLSEKGRWKLKRVKSSGLFKLTGKSNNLAVGEKVEIRTGYQRYTPATIKAVGVHNFLVEKINDYQLTKVNLRGIKQ